MHTNTTVYLSKKHHKELKESSAIRVFQIFGKNSNQSFSKYVQYLIVQDLIKNKLFKPAGFSFSDATPNVEEIAKQQKIIFDIRQREWEDL